ncbi:MAG: class I SAM-dependent methyltransferase [Candidatus Entotheonellia bacterium]
MSDSENILNAHYAGRDLAAAILDGLRAAGKEVGELAPDDLAAIDQFHIRGKEATLELAQLAGLGPGLQVLDVGGCLGGPARTLAAEFTCTVTVLDLTAAYCRAGEMLTARTGLSERVHFHVGNAVEMPFPSESFDVVWTQHSSMNIADKARLYAEIHRVLRPGGRLALYEIMAGAVQPIHFPVPWARMPSMSFLQPPTEVRRLIADSGLTEVTWLDVSKPSLAWLRQRRAMAPATPPPLGLHLLFGPVIGRMSQNLTRNLEEQRIAVIEAVFAHA